MHRILLSVLVIALLYLASDARRGEVLAARRGAEANGSAVLLARAELDPEAGSQAGALIRKALGPAFQDRLEARVEAESDFWAQFDVEHLTGPPAEEVLTDAEAWVEASFPEGGSTEKEPSPGSPELGPQGDLEQAGLAARAAHEGSSRATAREGSSDQDGEPSPIYVASMARIESLGGDLPAWCGLLDLALQPAGRRPFFEGSDGGLAAGDTAWISDDRGNLIARVEALDGMGLELDPSWPWIARQRRLFWTEGGGGGLVAQQYRLILEGNGFVPSWSGRLVLIHARPSGR